MPPSESCHDVLGVGFGPANLALAIALAEDTPTMTARYLEAQRDPVWQGGMLLDGSDIQNHPCRDLVSLRNPRSRYSFLNYLFEHDRLVEYLNLPAHYPLRKEYAGYIGWATGHFADQVDFGARVQTITVEDWAGAPAYAVTTEDGLRARGRALVLGCGRTPLVPPPFQLLHSPRIVHLSRYLYQVPSLDPAPRSIAVIGGSQSGVELTLDLASRFPDARVVMYLRAFGPRLKDTSPFDEEGYYPGFTEYYFKSSRESKLVLDGFMRPTNYSSADQDVINRLYLLIYEQRLDGRQRVSVRGNRVVRSASATATGVRLEIEERHAGTMEHDEIDLVVLATGFRDLGPAEHQESYPPLLAGVIDRFRFDEKGYLLVNADYSLVPLTSGTPPLYLNGLCESSHGIGDAGSFSLLSVRAAVIRDALCADAALAEPPDARGPDR